jgi:hypothetical protein
MNYSEHRHKEHKSRDVVSYLLDSPKGMKKGFYPVSTAGLPYKYRDYPNELKAHRAYYSDYLNDQLNQRLTVEFYYKIPEWSGLIECERITEEVRHYKKFAKTPAPRYKRRTCTIPIVASMPRYKSKEKEDIEVDIRTVIEETEYHEYD